MRRAFLAHTIAACDRTAIICYGTILSNTRAVIGENVYVGANCHLGFIELGRNVLLADRVCVPSGRHTHGTADAGEPIRDQKGRLEQVRIGSGTWVGTGAIVMADVGTDCVIAAGAVVTRPIPDRSIAAGVPARVIRSREAPRFAAV